MSINEKIKLYCNTIRHLKPIQIEYQLRVRLGKAKNEIIKSDNVYFLNHDFMIFNPLVDENPAFLQRFDVELLLDNNFKLLNETHVVDLSEWHVKDATHLWNFNLHYLEYLIPLSVKFKNAKDERYLQKWIEIVDSWVEYGSRQKDGMAPYTLSLRLTNLLICLGIIKEDLEPEFLHCLYQSIYSQYRYLQRNLELNLLANHYFENLKCIVLCSLLFNEQDIFHKYWELLLKQIDEQVLSDGVHFELSPMYHKIILEDILRVYFALVSVNRRGDAEKLVSTIKAMSSAVASLEKGFNRTPLFNDSGDNVAKSRNSLLECCRQIAPDIRDDISELSDSGYYKLYGNSTAIVFDCGQLGPSYMPGHSHCDCLSFELFYEGHPVFVNSGTFNYQSDLRSYFRSTAANNTFTVDGDEQSELWGEHRAARRISNVHCKREDKSFIGTFRSFKGISYKRKLLVQKDSMTIGDFARINDNDQHSLREFLHLYPGLKFNSDDGIIYVDDGQKRIFKVSLPPGSSYIIHRDGHYSEDFGNLMTNDVLEIITPFVSTIKNKIHIQKI